MTSVPTQDEFDDLASRVSELEQRLVWVVLAATNFTKVLEEAAFRALFADETAWDAPLSYSDRDHVVIRVTLTQPTIYVVDVRLNESVMRNKWGGIDGRNTERIQQKFAAVEKLLAKVTRSGFINALGRGTIYGNVTFDKGESADAR